MGKETERDLGAPAKAFCNEDISQGTLAATRAKARAKAREPRETEYYLFC